jgi:two-component system, NtrC family, response regulator HydG
MQTILVIDDERPIRNMMYQAFTKFGYHVETAENGRDGIKMFDDGCYDVVITDIRLPDIDGNEVAAHIRVSDKTAVVIGISGTGWLLKKDRFDLTFSKPFSLLELNLAIKAFFSEQTKAA